MNQKKWPFFLIVLLFLLTAPFPILPFSPYLALVYRRSSFIKSLWIAALCGVLMDLLTDRPFGIYALNLTIVTFFFYRLRVYFVDKLIGLASYTAILSLTTTLLSRLLLFLYGNHLPFTFKGMATDFLLMPLIDSLYAATFFSLPLIGYRFGKKLYYRFILMREESKKRGKPEKKRHA